MKKKLIVILTILAAVLIGIAVVIVFSGSKSAKELNEYEKKLLGGWGYTHDPDTRVAYFQPNGKAEFEGKKYRFSSDGEHIRFENNSDEAIELRYVQDDQDQNRLYLYLKNKYVPMEEYPSDGVVGVWICKETNWTFEFTDKGTFMEDGVLTGHYLVDEENGTITLLYEKFLEDTVFYYRLSDDGMFVEYPWLMTRQQ